MLPLTSAPAVLSAIFFIYATVIVGLVLLEFAGVVRKPVLGTSLQSSYFLTYSTNLAWELRFVLSFHASTHRVRPRFRHHVAMSGIRAASAGVVALDVKTIAPAVISVVESLNWIFHVRFHCYQSTVNTVATSATGGVFLTPPSEFVGTKRIFYLP